MSIVLAAEHPGVGAAETYLFTLGQGLAERSHRVSILVPRPIRGDAERRAPDCRILDLPDPVSSVYRAAGRAVDDADVVHVNHAVSPVLVALRRRAPVRLITDHVLPLRPHYGVRGRLLQKATRKAATGLVVFSRQNAALAGAGWGTLPVHVVYPGVPPLSCDLEPAARPLIGCVGRLTEQKRFGDLLAALSLLRAEGFDAEAVIVGAGEDEVALRKTAADLGVADQVAFAGHVDDVGAALAGCWVYAQPSAWEGICFALLEAMSLGLPFVATDLPAFEEVNEGVGAPLVPVGDARLIADSLRSLIEDREAAERLGRAARDRWRTVFTVEGMVDRHEALYVELLGEIA
jgi:glycosyltransferase involved in cell wall biosynthesis